QAEDGIRDRNVTGVQTCALPIYTGDCLLQRWAGIETADTAGTLAARLAEIGAPLLAESLRLAHAGTAPRRPQDSTHASYAPKLTDRKSVVEGKSVDHGGRQCSDK